MANIFERLETGRRKLAAGEIPQQNIATVTALINTLQQKVDTYNRAQAALLDATKAEKHTMIRAWIVAFEDKLGSPKVESSERLIISPELRNKLEKELHKLQRDLNSSRLQTYREGDTSEEEANRKKEREVKLSRFNEIIKILNTNAEDFPESQATQETGTHEVPTIKTDIPFEEIVTPMVLEFAKEEVEQSIAQMQQQIIETDKVPEDWQGTAKEYKEKNRIKRESLAKARDEYKAELSQLKQGELTTGAQSILASLKSEQNGIANQDQINTYIEKLENDSFDVVKNLDYYPTPPNVARRAVHLARIENGMSVLEPSAGKGNIADIIRSEYPSCKIDVCEYSEHNRKILQLKNYNIVGTDFLEYGITGRNANNFPIYDSSIAYDRIVMNPPYMKGIDWVHIEHAYNLLKPGGILVTIAPADSYIGTGREAVEKNTTIKEREGTITIIDSKDYNKEMEFSSLTIDIALITMVKQAEEENTIPIPERQRASRESSGFTKYGSLPLPPRRANSQAGWTEPDIVAANKELMPDISKIPDYVRQIKLNHPVSLFPHQYEGINRAIHGLLTNTGFLLADGTGAGKTIQMLLISTWFYQKYNLPVSLFTIDDRVITSSFMKDAIKIGLEAPEYVEPGELIPVQRPEGYMGLYDAIDALMDKDVPESKKLVKLATQEVDSKLIPKLYFGDNRNLKTKDGINLFRYKALETTFDAVDAERDKLKTVEAKVAVSNNWWSEIYALGVKLINKDNKTFFEYLDNAVLAREDREKIDKDNDELMNDSDVLGDEEENTDEPKLTEKEKKERVARYRMYMSRWASILSRLRDLDGKQEQEEVKKAVNYKIDNPYTKAQQALVVEQAKFENFVERHFSTITAKCSLLVWDEAHKIKNQLATSDKDISRSYYAKHITSGAKYVLFATATPADRPYDIMYLSRCGISKDEQHFMTLMKSVGVHYQNEKRNEKDEIIERGFWYFTKDPEAERQRNFELSNIFDRCVRQGGMIRREIQYTNLDANFVDVELPDVPIKTILKEITKSLTKADSKGKARINKIKEYQRHLEVLEEYKVDEVIEITQRELNEGRNVIIFTNFVDEGTKEREDGGKKFGTVRELKTRLSDLYGEDNIGILVGASGSYEKYKRLDNVDKFQKGTKRIMIGTINSGGTGVNLDDDKGDAPRTMIVMTAPLSFINVMQGIGRVVRANTKSRSRVYFLFAKTDNPKPEKAVIPVERWLKNLIGNKFRTLRATVKGEIDALSPDAVQRAEAGGEGAAASEVDSAVSLTKEHSWYTFTKARKVGWELPCDLPYKIERYGNTKKHYCVIGAKTKAILDAWAANNKEFIEKYGLVRNIDENHRRYNGDHYGMVFPVSDTKRWTESYDLWNAMLNILQPEEMKFMTSGDALYNIGDTVISNVNFIGSNTAPGDEGVVTEVIPQVIGTNDNGNVYRYVYDIEWKKNGYYTSDVQAWQLKLPQADMFIAPAKYKAGDIFFVPDKWSPKLYTITAIAPKDESQEYSYYVEYVRSYKINTDDDNELMQYAINEMQSDIENGNEPNTEMESEFIEDVFAGRLLGNFNKQQENINLDTSALGEEMSDHFVSNKYFREE